MTNAIATKPSYEIEGIYFKEDGQVVSDTSFLYSDSDSMIDHQKTWYEEARKNGYPSGELDEAAIIRKNYNGEITDEQMIAIVNDGELMDTPFGELFPKKLNAYLVKLLESEYGDLEAYVLENKGEQDCSEEMARMNSIRNHIGRLTFHGN
ncbi:hypothetical protein [Evansella clarkii]|uniref:hypothetical protein n=1 Tax=Evansella clarkii TaxID=79879 RepID=UPI0009978040|nr:hypothetical protein [Evansella clarkii]